jgi:hypothetical protein
MDRAVKGTHYIYNKACNCIEIPISYQYNKTFLLLSQIFFRRFFSKNLFDVITYWILGRFILRSPIKVSILHPVSLLIDFKKIISFSHAGSLGFKATRLKKYLLSLPRPARQDIVLITCIFCVWVLLIIWQAVTGFEEIKVFYSISIWLAPFYMIISLFPKKETEKKNSKDSGICLYAS